MCDNKNGKFFRNRDMNLNDMYVFIANFCSIVM